MALRTVSGTINYPNGTPWVNPVVTFKYAEYFTAGGVTVYPDTAVSLTGSGAGVINGTITTPDQGDGTVVVFVTFPTGYTFPFALGFDAAPLSLAALIQAAAAIASGTYPNFSDTNALADIAALQVDMATAQGDITTIQGDITTIQGDVLNLTTVLRTTADRTGATDATAQIQADLATAAALGYKRLYLPAGTYKLAQVGGVLFGSAANDLEIFGDGIGKTILSVPASTTLTSDLILFRLTGQQQWLHDFSIQIGAGAAGAFDMHAIQVYQGSFYTRLTRIEISGVYGNGTAGGGGIETYQPYSTNEVTTTLGTIVAAPGAATVTPGSMAGIYAGRTLIIGGATETIQVTSITETTFTATFANAHGAADSVSGQSLGHQYALIEDCLVRDSYKCSAFIINSSANVFRRCQVYRVGSNGNQHGFYIQGGQNLFDACFVEGAGGYSYHGHKQVQGVDGSGDRLIGCVSINPGTQHLIYDSLNSDGSNSNVANGIPLTRYAAIIGCAFTRTKNGPACAGVTSTVPLLIDGCVFEDTVGSATPWCNAAAQSTISNNIFRWLNGGGANPNGITAVTGSVVQGNQFINWSSGGAAIIIGASCRILGNAIQLAGSGVGMSLGGNDATVESNVITGAGGIGINSFVAAYTGFVCRNNTLNYTTTSAQMYLQSTGVPSGVIAGNVLSGTLRYDAGNAALVIRDHIGGLAFRSNSTPTITMDAAAGRLLQFAKGANTLTVGLLAGISAGALATIATTDAVFLGVATSNCDATSSNVFVVGEVGAEAKILCDAAWAAGNIGIASTTAAGKIHDSGLTTAPASGSYVLFLDSGGGAGTARCLIIKTL